MSRYIRRESRRGRRVSGTSECDEKRRAHRGAGLGTVRHVLFEQAGLAPAFHRHVWAGERVSRGAVRSMEHLQLVAS